eukprot:507742-Pelagomonas_calceolata.AAC.12
MSGEKEHEEESAVLVTQGCGVLCVYVCVTKEVCVRKWSREEEGSIAILCKVAAVGWEDNAGEGQAGWWLGKARFLYIFTRYLPEGVI